MKKKNLLTGMLLFGVAISANAQFRVHSNGNLSLQSSATPLSPISINCVGDTSTHVFIRPPKESGIVCCQSLQTSGIAVAGFFDSYSSNSISGYFSHTGILASASRGGTNYAQTCKGVVGEAEGANRALGVVGSIDNCTKGAGVYGTSQGDTGSGLPSNRLYAGYFNGDTHVTGNLTVAGTVQGVLLGESSQISSSESDMKLSWQTNLLTEKILSLQTAVYRKERPVIVQEEREALDEKYEPTAKPIKNILEDQYYEKEHYAFDANQLEKVFPNLVYVKDDGTKAINYMEMIPLLVQTINELNARLVSVENGEMEMSREMLATEFSGTKQESTASLIQNSPNPFSSQTQICFTLPDNTRNAYIYIFDMTGKMQKQIAVNSSMESVTINGYELSAGIYLYSLVVNGQEVDTKRMILSK